MELSPKNVLQFKIQEAYAEYVDIAKEEIQEDFSDIMQSMERTEATGYLNGLEVAYTIVFGEVYDYPCDFDPTEYEESRSWE